MTRRTATTSVCTLPLALVLCCSSAQRVESRASTGDGEAKRVLIATRPSDFKKRIVDKLVDSYRDRAKLSVIELAEISDIRTTDYDAMVVMGARMGFLLFSARERRFLRRLPNKERLILVMTAASQDWEWDRDDVDVITCASRSENVDPTYREVSTRLDALLAP